MSGASSLLLVCYKLGLREVRRSDTNSVTRSQRDYPLLLYLHGFDIRIAHPRRWCCTSWKRPISILRSCTERSHFRTLRFPPHQRIRRIPALRGRYRSVSLAYPPYQLGYVHHYGSDITGDLQIMGWNGTIVNSSTLRRAVPCLWSRAASLCCHAGHSCGANSGRSLAIRRYLLWCYVLDHRPSRALCFQQHDLQRLAALPGWTLYRHYLQLIGCHDGLQGSFAYSPASTCNGY